MRARRAAADRLLSGVACPACRVLSGVAVFAPSRGVLLSGAPGVLLPPPAGVAGDAVAFLGGVKAEVPAACDVEMAGGVARRARAREPERTPRRCAAKISWIRSSSLLLLDDRRCAGECCAGDCSTAGETLPRCPAGEAPFRGNAPPFCAGGETTPLCAEGGEIPPRCAAAGDTPFCFAGGDTGGSPSLCACGDTPFR